MTTITFVDPSGVEHEVEGVAGKTLMALAVDHDIPGIEGECGGELACGTCHIYIDDAGDPTPPPRNDDEAQMLEALVDAPGPTSRLGCQIEVTSALEGLRVTVGS